MRDHQTKCQCHRWKVNEAPGRAEHLRKLKFIDTVCGLLIESRFGPGARYEPIAELGDQFYFCSEQAEILDEYLDLTPHRSGDALVSCLSAGHPTSKEKKEIGDLIFFAERPVRARGSPAPGTAFLH